VVDGKTVDVETSIEDTLAVLGYVREVTGQPTAILVGESFGSAVAPFVAAQAPEQVSGLVLLGHVYRDGSEPLDASLVEMFTALAQEPAGYAYTTEEEWPELFIPSASPAVTAWHTSHFGTAYAYPVGPYLSIRALAEGPALANIRGRVLVITGAIDPYARVENTRKFLQALGTDKTRHLHQPGVGHLPYVEKELAAVQEAIATFVDEVTADQRAH
jgi:pimeloyl-ACP methyl ester carboxylesterase